jgi:hypothetical protein
MDRLIRELAGKREVLHHRFFEFVPAPVHPTDLHPVVTHGGEHDEPQHQEVLDRT